jgi:tetratricopeptide (TPR) repeat protein
LAELLSATGRPAEAIPLRRRELAWFRNQKGESDPEILMLIDSLAFDLHEVGELIEAEGLFRELVAGRQQVLDPSDFGIGRALGGLAKTLELVGKLKDAAVYGQQALDHRLKHEGSDAWWTNRNRLDLARVLFKLGPADEALQLLDQLQQSMGAISEPDQGDRDLIEAADELRAELGGDG